jgi:hypothetical protein
VRQALAAHKDVSSRLAQVEARERELDRAEDEYVKEEVRLQSVRDELVTTKTELARARAEAARRYAQSAQSADSCSPTEAPTLPSPSACASCSEGSGPGVRNLGKVARGVRANESRAADCSRRETRSLEPRCNTERAVIQGRLDAVLAMCTCCRAGAAVWASDPSRTEPAGADAGLEAP